MYYGDIGVTVLISADDRREVSYGDNGVTVVISAGDRREVNYGDNGVIVLISTDDRREVNYNDYRTVLVSDHCVCQLVLMSEEKCTTGITVYISCGE